MVFLVARCEDNYGNFYLIGMNKGLGFDKIFLMSNSRERGALTKMEVQSKPLANSQFLEFILKLVSHFFDN